MVQNAAIRLSSLLYARGCFLICPEAAFLVMVEHLDNRYNLFRRIETEGCAMSERGSDFYDQEANFEKYMERPSGRRMPTIHWKSPSCWS